MSFVSPVLLPSRQVLPHWLIPYQVGDAPLPAAQVTETDMADDASSLLLPSAGSDRTAQRSTPMGAHAEPAYCNDLLGYLQPFAAFRHAFLVPLKLGGTPMRSFKYWLASKYPKTKAGRAAERA
jgi:hypothetical protein